MLYGRKEVSGLPAGQILVAVEHKFGTLLVSRKLWLSVSGRFYYDEDGKMQGVDLGSQSKSVLEEILSNCQRLSSR